jgi:sulfhydrogenase subunit alpha
VRWVAAFDFPDHVCDVDLLALTQPGTYAIEGGMLTTRSGLMFPSAGFDAHVIGEQVPHSTALHAGLGENCTNPFQSIVVRAVETVYAVEEALRLITAYKPPDPPAVEVPSRAGTGFGPTESPRGTLWHRYEIDVGGLITAARIVPPTSQNQAAIEADLRQFVQAHLDVDDAELTRRCEQAIRNYDPCISCSSISP